MRLAMVISEQRLTLEQRMLNRLAVGLMAEGVQVTRIVPPGQEASMQAEGERRMALAPRLEAHMRSMPWMRRVHVGKTAESLEASPPDALYLLGREAWAFGLHLAAELDRPAILEVWSATQAGFLPRRPAAGARSHLAAVTAPCAGIAERVQQRVGRELTCLVPFGVSAPRTFGPVLNKAEQPLSIAVLGGARDVNAYSAMFAGIARTMESVPALEIFLELRGPHEHDVWRAAERAGVIAAISAFGSASHHHTLLARCDAVVCPEHYGELRCVMLEAMAMAVPVIAANDPALDMLTDGTTAKLVVHEAAVAWSEALTSVLTDASMARRLGSAAQELVSTRHRSSEQVESLFALLHRVVGTDAYTFPTPAQ